MICVMYFVLNRNQLWDPDLESIHKRITLAQQAKNAHLAIRAVTQLL